MAGSATILPRQADPVPGVLAKFRLVQNDRGMEFHLAIDVAKNEPVCRVRRHAVA